MTKTKEISDESVQDILDMWKNALEKAECVTRYHIDEKVIDYDLIPDEVNCNECTSPFCFKKLEWDDAQEEGINKNGMTPPKVLKEIDKEIIKTKIVFNLNDIEEWKRAYV